MKSKKNNRQLIEEEINDVINSMSDAELLHWKRFSERTGKNYIHILRGFAYTVVDK